jgi:hypothetical protein
VYSPKIVASNREKLERALGLALRDYSLEECREFAYRMRKVDWSPGVAQVLSTLPDDIQRYVVNELHLSKIDFKYWLQRYCYILSTRRQLITIEELWPSQEKLLKYISDAEEVDPKIRMILLKARQIGGTVISEALGAHMTFLQPNTQSIIGADHPDMTLKLWQTLLRIYDHLPGWMKPLPDSKPKATNLHFPELDSDIVYGSGNQKTTFGQGMTVDFAHLTEISTWEYPEYLTEDLFPAFESSEKHNSLLILESTGKGGIGNWFHDLFQASWKGKNEFIPAFIAWYHRPSYCLKSVEGLELDTQTLGLAERVKAEQGVELTKAQMGWWQRKRIAAEAQGELGIFLQEFPSTVAEAFQTGFQSVFPIELRTKLRSTVKPIQDVYEFNHTTKKLKVLDTETFVKSESGDKWDNKFIVYERKKPYGVYVVGVDVSYGIDGSDYSAVEVLRVGDKTRPDEQVAEWWGKLDGLKLASVVWVVGHVFCDQRDGFPAKVAVEVNPGSPGILTQTELMRKGYPHFFRWRRPLRQDGKYSAEVGWWTTGSTRPMITDKGLSCIKSNDLIINSPEFISEMDTYVYAYTKSGNRQLGHAPGYHDDRIMALFIALGVAHWDDLQDLAEERRKREVQRQNPAPQTQQFNQILTPYDKLMEEWENSLIDPW